MRRHLALLVSFCHISFFVTSGVADLGNSGYVGSEKCLTCHLDLHSEIAEGWQNASHHLTMSEVNGNADLPGNFELNSLFSREDVWFVIGHHGERSVYIDRESSVLPLEWLRVDSVWVERERSDASQSCFGCHATGYFVSKRQFVETGVGCEACHGPGRAHLESEGGAATIVNPADLPRERARMTCGQCHSLGKDPSGRYPFPVLTARAGLTDEAVALRPFEPGRDLELAFVDAKPLIVQKGGEYSLLVQAPEYYADQVCTDCHDPHGMTENPRMLIDSTSGLCLRCHGDSITDLESHWGADKAPCWDCHEYVHTH